MELTQPAQLTLLTEKQRLIDREVEALTRQLREGAIRQMGHLCAECGNPDGMEPFIRDDFCIPYRAGWWEGFEFWCKPNCPGQVFITCVACRGHNTQALDGYRRITHTKLQAWINGEV